MTTGHYDTEPTTCRDRPSLQKIRSISDTALFHVLQNQRDHDLKKKIFSPVTKRIAARGEAANRGWVGPIQGVHFLLVQNLGKCVKAVYAILAKCRLLSLQRILNDSRMKGTCASQGKSRRKPDEIRWYFITSDELMEIQKRLRTFEALPLDEKRLSVLEIIGIITKVELRPA